MYKLNGNKNTNPRNKYKNEYTKQVYYKTLLKKSQAAHIEKLGRSNT